MQAVVIDLTTQMPVEGAGVAKACGPPTTRARSVPAEGQNQHQLLAQRLGNVLKEGKSERQHAAQTLKGGTIEFVHDTPLEFVHDTPLHLAGFPSAQNPHSSPASPESTFQPGLAHQSVLTVDILAPLGSGAHQESPKSPGSCDCTSGTSSQFGAGNLWLCNWHDLSVRRKQTMDRELELAASFLQHIVYYVPK
jgi:hypothetical protein